MAQTVCRVYQKEVSGWTTSSFGEYSDRSPLDRIAMDILDVCDPTPDVYRYILAIADYFKMDGGLPYKEQVC